MNVSSVVVQLAPKHKKNVLGILKKNKDLCDVFYHDENGRIIVTIEGETIEEEISKLKALQDIPKVISADMVYSYSEDELDAIRESIVSQKNIVPKMLNDESIKAENIIYHGSSKKI